jgi:hypothetical protein
MLFSTVNMLEMQVCRQESDLNLTQQSLDKAFFLCLFPGVHAVIDRVGLESAIVFEADDWYADRAVIDKIHEID